MLQPAYPRGLIGLRIAQGVWMGWTPNAQSGAFGHLVSGHATSKSTCCWLMCSSVPDSRAAAAAAPPQPKQHHLNRSNLWAALWHATPSPLSVD